MPAAYDIFALQILRKNNLSITDCLIPFSLILEAALCAALQEFALCDETGGAGARPYDST